MQMSAWERRDLVVFVWGDVNTDPCPRQWQKAEALLGLDNPAVGGAHMYYIGGLLVKCERRRLTVVGASAGSKNWMS
jgi:hypothetical protein